MTRDLHKRLGRLEAQTSPAVVARFFAVEGPPGLMTATAQAFLRSRGHSWDADDLVFFTIYESSEAQAPLRDLTRGQPL